MKWNYLFKHWGLTILIAPILFILPDLWENYTGILSFLKRIVEFMLHAYYMFFLLGLLYSIPTYLIYAVIFYFLKREKVDHKWSKIILILTAQLGIWSSFYILSEALLSGYFIFLAFSYSFCSLISGLFLKISK